MCNYIIRHYWDIKSKSATLKPEWLGNKLQDLSKEQQVIKKIYEQTIGDATNYELLAKSELSEEVIGDYHIQYTYIHKVDPLGRDDKNTRHVTDIEMCITKISKKKLNVTSYWVIVLSVMILGGMWIASGNFSNDSNDSNELIVSKIETKQDIKLQNKKIEIINAKKPIPQKNVLKEKVCSSSLSVGLPTKIGMEKCWQQYIYDRCRDKTKLGFVKYWDKKESIDCVFDNSSKYIDDLLKKERLPSKYKNFFRGEDNEER